MHNLQKDVVVEPVKWGKKMFQSQALPKISVVEKVSIENTPTFLQICPFKQNKSKVGLFT